SGHIIFRAYATTGDGMLTALQILATTRATTQHAAATLDELAEDFTVYPQLLINVRVKERRPLEEIPAAAAAMRECEREMNGSGRILVRYSGTEPLARIMVEGLDHADVERWAERIASVIRRELA